MRNRCKDIHPEVKEYNAKNQQDYLKVVFAFDGRSWGVHKSLATDELGHWFLCDAEEGEELPRSEAQEVSLAEVCSWYWRCEPFAEGSNGSIAELLKEVATELTAKA